jgi:hypothetical protein
MLCRDQILTKTYTADLNAEQSAASSIGQDSRIAPKPGRIAFVGAKLDRSLPHVKHPARAPTT